MIEYMSLQRNGGHYISDEYRDETIHSEDTLQDVIAYKDTTETKVILISTRRSIHRIDIDVLGGPDQGIVHSRALAKEKMLSQTVRTPPLDERFSSCSIRRAVQ